MANPSLLCIGLLIASATTLAPAAKADKFWLEPKDAQTVEGSQPSIIVGVLLGEEDDVLHIRIVGGEMWLGRSSVHAIDKDDLTVKSIERSENKGRDSLAKAEAARRSEQEDRQLRRQRRRTAFAQEASARRLPIDQIEPPGGRTDSASGYSFDPVIDRAIVVGATDQQRMLELETAYKLSRDRSLIKQLRRLRRLR